MGLMGEYLQQQLERLERVDQAHRKIRNEQHEEYFQKLGEPDAIVDGVAMWYLKDSDSVLVAACTTGGGYNYYSQRSFSRSLIEAMMGVLKS